MVTSELPHRYQSWFLSVVRMDRLPEGGSMTRRHLLKLVSTFIALPLLHMVFSVLRAMGRTTSSQGVLPAKATTIDGVTDMMSHVYVTRGKKPEENMRDLLQLLGGIEKIIGSEDIVILKPNAQWWNQGTTNTNAMKAFIEAILKRPRFHGEIIIAENHQYDEPNSRGWTTIERNGDYNLNELVEYFQKLGHPNVTKYHWRPVTPQSKSKTDPANFSRIVESPWQGDGYVYDKKLIYTSPLGRRCILSYPIFTSSYSGTVIDFKNGAWKNGKYTSQQVKFINFSGINHHGSYCGVTASVKNYMGIVDMSCGAPRGGPEGFFNVHNVGVRELPNVYERYVPWRIRNKLELFWETNYSHKYFHHTGGCLGAFMRKVRMADLNIITADWVGFGSRTNTSLSGHPKALLASTDPVALDSWAAREILLPLTQTGPDRETFSALNNPDSVEGPFRKFLQECHSQGIGNLDPSLVKTHRVT